MTDYIDREAAIALWENDTERGRTEFDQVLMLMPAADAEPIVRCKDCKHRDPEDKRCDSGGLERAGNIFPVSDDYFCACGEKRS